MRPTTPLQEKTPFAITAEPMDAIITARAGLSAVSRALRSLGLPGFCEAHVNVKQRSRGFTVGQQVESLVMLHASGGDCKEDMESLREDTGITKMLGYAAPSARCVGDFLELFHDQEKVSNAREQAHAQGGLAFIPEQTVALEGLGCTASCLVGSIAKLQGAPTQATIDMDATIIESHKRDAKRTYEGTRGYQPMVAMWAETNLIVADEFRDGNVPAMMAPLVCAKAALAALPKTVTQYSFRGDSACHESGLINWLRNEQRDEGPKGPILFAVSARMSVELAQAVKNVPDTQWFTVATEKDGTLRQCAEVDFVPGEKVEKKSIEPLRYVGLRLLKPQGDLFSDGHGRHFHAVLTNRTEESAWILTWQRAKAGTIEHIHDELKNGLGGGQLPSNKFGANAAWFRIACMAHNVLQAIRYACPDEELKNAKAKRLRFKLFNVTGRFSRDRRKISLHLAAPVKWIKQLIELFNRFPLATRATG